MCLLISKVRHHAKLDKYGLPYYTARKATKPIKCYKHLEFNDEINQLATPYQYLPIKFDRSGQAVIIGIGFQPTRICDVDETPSVCCGVHAYRSKKESSYYLTESMWDFQEFLAIIPRGERYFIGKDGDIVASKMILFRSKNAFKKYLNGQDTIEIK